MAGDCSASRVQELKLQLAIKYTRAQCESGAWQVMDLSCLSAADQTNPIASPDPNSIGFGKVSRVRGADWPPRSSQSPLCRTGKQGYWQAGGRHAPLIICVYNKCDLRSLDQHFSLPAWRAVNNSEIDKGRERNVKL